MLPGDPISNRDMSWTDNLISLRLAPALRIEINGWLQYVIFFTLVGVSLRHFIVPSDQQVWLSPVGGVTAQLFHACKLV